jgi:UDP-N-acetylmuramoylalanine--D-glutamate ligase
MPLTGPLTTADRTPVAGEVGSRAVTTIAVVGSTGGPTIAALVRAMLRASGYRLHGPRSAALGLPELLGERDRVVVALSWPLPEYVAGLSVLVVTGLAADELPSGIAPGAATQAVRALARQARDAVVVFADDAHNLHAAAAATVPIRRAALGDRSADATVVDGEVVLNDGGLVHRAVQVDTTPLGSGPLLADLVVAACAAVAAGARTADVRRVARRYRAPADHFEHLRTLDGVDWVSDAAATSPGRAAAALDGIARPVILIAGGMAGGQPWRRWAQTAARQATHVLLYGSAAGAMADALIDAGAMHKLVRCADILDAVQVAQRLAAPCDRVVHCPACLPEPGASPGPTFRAAVAGREPAEEAA